MCGITGFINFNNHSSYQELQQMTHSLNHRGPDDEGTKLFNHIDIQVGLGHKRLSIIDVSKRGQQPMSNNVQDCHLVYNGEIYNHITIRKELELDGYQFFSTSDTEVVLKAYDRWGINAINRFIGMFAFTIFDQKTNKVFIVRDRAGVKPMYYYWNKMTFLFASELKSFFNNKKFYPKLNLNSLSLYFHYGYIPSPYCIYDNCYKLQPGHYLEVDLSQKKVVENKYWDVIDFYNKPKLKISKTDALHALETILINAFEYRMVSDVPVGVFLSGGFDSSIVTALLQKNRSKKIKTFTIGFQEKCYNEALFAKQVASYLGTDHEEFTCTQQDALEIVPQLPHIFDEPFADASAIPTILVSRIARKKVKVCLSADGGDETFAGYVKYDGALRYHKLTKILPFTGVLSNIINKIPLKLLPIINCIPNIEKRAETLEYSLKHNASPVMIMDIISQLFRFNEMSKLFVNSVDSYPSGFQLESQLNKYNDHINKMLAIDYKSYLPDDVLTKVDRASMSIGLEAREPLLDHRIIEFAAQLPSHFKYNQTKKYILKQLCYHYIPKSLLNRPKKGFSAPIGFWLQNQLTDYLSDYLSSKRIKQENIFNYQEIKRNLKNLQAGDYAITQKIWSILMFEMWYERYFGT
jgi:asparagine synthase (glutamine-hydrolysing)